MTQPKGNRSESDRHPSTFGQKIADLFLVSLARLTLRIFFRRIEIDGTENIPRDAPLILVANHFNGLVDPLLLSFLPVRPRFLAKSTLWQNPLVRPLLGLSAAVPVYRQQDEGADLRRNAETFAICLRRLANGATIALFPEGKSHSESGLAPLKTGAARIALGAIANDAQLGLRIIPVGLTFDEKFRFRSRVLLRVGDPIDPAMDLPAYTENPHAAVRSLTTKISEGLRAVTLNYSSHAEARMVDRTAAFLFEQQENPGSRGAQVRNFELRKQIAAGYRELQFREQTRIDAFQEALAQHDKNLRVFKLHDQHVANADSLHGWRKLSGLLLLAPIALFGAITNWIPYRAAGQIAQRVENSPDLPATYKLFSGFVLLPLAWLIESAAAWYFLEPVTAALTLVAVPVTGFAAMVFAEQLQVVLRTIRAQILFRMHPGLADLLREQRDSVETQLQTLILAYDAHLALQTKNRSAELNQPR